MQRTVIFAFTTAILAGSASAQQMMVATSRGMSAPPQMVVVAQPPQMRANLGGGFIEYVFGDHEQQPRYAAPPQQYIAPPQVYADPAQAAPSRQVYANVAPAADPTQDVARPGTPMDPRFLRQEVAYQGTEQAGSIVIDTPNHFLYLVEGGGKAMRYGIGVGRPGFTWSGVHTVSAKKEWPDWTPPEEMLQRQPYLPRHMEGGPHNPLGARAMYLGSTLYRIHGSNEPWTIGHNVSSGCIRLRNVDVIDLYNRVKVGAKVVVI
jgi:lipoprotein-anchoring transpeptidase ErfK/SrfK